MTRREWTLAMIQRRTILVVLYAAALAATSAPAGATGGPSCTATNARTAIVYTGSGSNLQSALDAASVGDSLSISGTCVGNYVTAKSLKLIGVSTIAYPAPTLDGNAAGVVLTVNAGSIKMRDLTVTNGSAPGCLVGGGIYIHRGNVTLLGSSSVRGNTSPCDGGGVFNGGSFIMKDASSVVGNTATQNGGGVYNFNRLRTSSFIMRGSSSVKGNTASHEGGGIFNADTLIVYGHAWVAGNAATAGGAYDGGGGIYTAANSTATLNGNARVRGNTSAGLGGGIIVSQGSAQLFLNDRSSVEGNSAVGRGGGIEILFGTVTLSGSSSVTGNTSDFYGGSIAIDSGHLNACDGPATFWTGTLSPNTPDDPISPTLISC